MTQIYIQTINSNFYSTSTSNSFYQILIFNGCCRFEINFIEYEFNGYTILFLTPYQQFKWLNDFEVEIKFVKFHGDYYCIEYHKNVISCNGFLFNNIYEKPFFNITKPVFDEVKEIIGKMKDEFENEIENPFSDSILKTYLQLILALSSKEKAKLLTTVKPNEIPNKDIVYFQELLEKYYITERSIAYYASEFSLSPNAFSKKIKQQFTKTPSQLIQERVILESKKLLHLTYKSVKEIAQELHFEDEFYFSRYFKKNVGISPTIYRKNVGISIVAKKSMD